MMYVRAHAPDSEETFKSLPSSHQFRVMQEINEKKEKQRGRYHCDRTSLYAIHLTPHAAQEDKKVEKREVGTFGTRREMLDNMHDQQKKISPNTLLETSVY